MGSARVSGGRLKARDRPVSVRTRRPQRTGTVSHIFKMSAEMMRLEDKIASVMYGRGKNEETIPNVQLISISGPVSNLRSDKVVHDKT